MVSSLLDVATKGDEEVVRKVLRVPGFLFVVNVSAYKFKYFIFKVLVELKRLILKTIMLTENRSDSASRMF